jgi:hypothetical protein
MSDFPYILGFNHQLTDYHKRYFYIDRKGIAYFINCYSGDDYVGEFDGISGKSQTIFSIA